MTATILAMVKSRLNRIDNTLDNYLTGRITAAIQELESTGIYVKNSARDIMLVTDMVCWQYSNRDKASAMPEWLKLARRERFLQEERHSDT